ncbi:hypothetical protein MRX96_010063 [Rhipicephalus microplus]
MVARLGTPGKPAICSQTQRTRRTCKKFIGVCETKSTSSCVRVSSFAAFFLAAVACQPKITSFKGSRNVPRESRSKQTQVTQDNFVPTAGPSKPPEAICITDMSCKNFRIHLKPNASLKIRELFRKKLLKDDSEPECKKKKTQE